MRKLTMFTFVAVLFIALAGSGCDPHKSERASLSTQIAGVESKIARVNNERAGVSNNMEAIKVEGNRYADSLQQHSLRHRKLQDELNLYVMDHKLATLAVMATAGGVASVVEENMDKETKDALAVIGLIGAVYCIFNAEECADVTTRVLYFGSQIKAEEKNISSLTQTLSQKKQALRACEESYASLSSEIGRLTAERNKLQQQHDSLLCKGLCL